MPLLKKIMSPTNSKIWIWHITEDIDYLISVAQSKFDLSQDLLKCGPQRIKEWICSRLLLAEMKPEIQIAFNATKEILNTGNENIFAAVSHTKQYACAIVGDNCAVGIDIEEISTKPLRISNRFSSLLELDYLKEGGFESEFYFTLLWTVKEAVFKKFLLQHLDFKNEIELVKIIKINSENYKANVKVKGNLHQVIILTINNHVMSYIE